MNLHGNVVDPSLWLHSHALILKGTSRDANKTSPWTNYISPPTFTSRAAADSISDGLCMLAQRQSGPKHDSCRFAAESSSAKPVTDEGRRKEVSPTITWEAAGGMQGEWEVKKATLSRWEGGDSTTKSGKSWCYLAAVAGVKDARKLYFFNR